MSRCRPSLFHRAPRPALVPVLCLALAALLGAGAALAEGIGYVDMERVLQESALGRAAQARLEERFGARQQPFAEEETAIRRLQQTLERDRPLMSRAQIEKTEQEIAERIARFESDFAEVQQEVVEAQQEEGRKIIAPAREAVETVARQKQLTVVFEANQAGVMYLDTGADITSDVIAAIDAKARR